MADLTRATEYDMIETAYKARMKKTPGYIKDHLVELREKLDKLTNALESVNLKINVANNLEIFERTGQYPEWAYTGGRRKRKSRKKRSKRKSRKKRSKRKSKHIKR